MATLVESLQHIAINPEDWYMDESTLKAHKILSSIPGTENYEQGEGFFDVNTKRIEHLQNNFNNPDFQDYVLKHPSLFDAFPNELSSYTPFMNEVLKSRQITQAAPPAPLIENPNMVPLVNVAERNPVEPLNERRVPRTLSSGPLVSAAGSTEHPENSQEFKQFIKDRNESPAFEDSSGFVSSMSNDDFAELSRYEENARLAHEEDQEAPGGQYDHKYSPAYEEYDEVPGGQYDHKYSPAYEEYDEVPGGQFRGEEPAFGRALGLNRSEDQIKKDVAISKALDRGDYDAVMRIQEGKEPELDNYSYMDEQRHRYQDGGFVPPEEAPVPVDGPPLPEDDMGFVGSPEEAAVDQVDAAQNGDMGGDNVEADVPEGSFVLNSYAVELAGIKDIEKLVKDAKKFYMEQKQQEGLVSPDAGQEEDIEIRVSEGEYIIPPALVRIIGRDRLEKINKRGIDEFERQQAEETEAGGQEMPQEPQGFMPQEEAAPMQQEMAAPMPQGFATGGGVQSDVSVPLFQTLNALQGVFGKSQQKTAQAPKRKKVAAVAQPRGRQNVARPKLPQQQPNQPLTGITPSAGGFMQPGGVGSKKKYDVGGSVAPIPRWKPISPKESNVLDPFYTNNPGNVEARFDWAGTVGRYATKREREKGKSSFAVFSHPVLGIRALARDLKTKIGNKKGNLREIITRYAPKNENKTQNYINFIQSEIKNKNKNKTVTTVTEKDLPALVKAVIKFENTKADKDYYMKNPEWIEEGIELSKKSIPGTLKTLEEVREYVYPPIPKEKPKKMEGGFVSA